MFQDISEAALERAALISMRTSSGDFPQPAPFFCTFYHVIYMSMPLAEGARELVWDVRVHPDTVLAEVVTFAIFSTIGRDSIARGTQESWPELLFKWHLDAIREALDTLNIKVILVAGAHLRSRLLAVRVSASICLLTRTQAQISRQSEPEDGAMQLSKPFVGV